MRGAVDRYGFQELNTIEDIDFGREFARLAADSWEHDDICCRLDDFYQRANEEGGGSDGCDAQDIPRQVQK